MYVNIILLNSKVEKRDRVFLNFINKLKKYYYDPDFEIEFFAVITGQKCTLHCKNCVNFSPYYPKCFDFYDMEKTIEDLENVTKRIKCIKKLHIQGGDFFLHKDALKLLEYVAKSSKIEKCQIATNCILKPRQELLNVLKNPKFSIRISSYDVVNEIKKEDFEKILIENGVKHRFYKYANKTGMWSDAGGIDTPKHSEEETKRNYLNCIFKRCLTLENGIISRCARATVAHHLQKFKLKKRDYVNVRSPFFAIATLKKFINLQNTDGGGVTACFYCNGTSGKEIPAGEQLTPEEIKCIRQNSDK